MSTETEHWLNRQLRLAERATSEWPDWKRKEAGIDINDAPVPPEPRVEVESGKTLRIAIAEALGYKWWTYKMRESYLCLDGPPFERSGMGRSPWERGKQAPLSVDALHRVPDWPADLTAAHSLGAEAVRIGFAEDYLMQLWGSVNFDNGLSGVFGTSDNVLKFGLLHATAEQRAVAWYRAYLAWKDEKGKQNEQ